MRVNDPNFMKLSNFSKGSFTEILNFCTRISSAGIRVQKILDSGKELKTF